MNTDIRAVIISDDTVSSAVLAHSLKELWSSGVSCHSFPSVKSAMRSAFLDKAEIVFLAAMSDEVELYHSIRAIHGRADAPICVVVTPAQGAGARAAALRAGAHDCINRYVATEDDIYRCLWGVLRRRTAAQLQRMSQVPAYATA